MANIIDDTFVDRLLRHGYLDTKDRVRELAKREDLPTAAQEAARDLREGWNSWDAHTIVSSFGLEIWSRLRPELGKLTVDPIQVTELRLGKRPIFSEGRVEPRREKLTDFDFRGKERYG